MKPDGTARVVVDAGGTRLRIGRVGDDGRPGAICDRPADAFPELGRALRDYLEREGLPAPETEIRMAVAGPVGGPRIRFTNRAWEFDVTRLCADLGLRRLQVINDFAALALALPRLRPDEQVTLQEGQAQAGEPRVVLGPGTGLGVATAIPAGGQWWPVAGEGGHATLAPRDDEQAELLLQARRCHGHVSAETLLSGPGLRRLYALTAAARGEEGPAPEPRRISALAAGGDPVAAATLALFFDLLGGFAGDVVLICGARGGLWLAGGILPALAGELRRSRFLGAFRDKGRFHDYLARVPVYLITAPYPALIGLAGALPPELGVSAPSGSGTQSAAGTCGGRRKAGS